MSLRDIINKYHSAAVAAAVIVLAFAVYRTLRTTGVVSTGPPAMYYYDLKTHKTFAVSQAPPPPIAAPSGGEGVLAYVFACNSCNDDADRFVAYIEKYTDEAKAELLKAQPNLQLVSDGQRRARAGDNSGGDPQWVALDSPAAGELSNIPFSKCDEPKRCLP